MKWMRYRHEGLDGFGTLQGDCVQPYQGDLFGAHEAVGAPLPVADLVWRTPCTPGKMLALWNNFHAAAAKNNWAPPSDPLYFVKTPNSYAPHAGPVLQPVAYQGRVLFEGELAIVIGRQASRVSAQEAPAHVFGYTCANDLTAIDLLNADPAFAQWTRAKGLDGFGVFGPVIDTDFDPARPGAAVRTVVAGRERQNYAVADMFFSPAELVSRISHDMTLQAGDVILCGTSVGAAPLKPGQRVEVVIDGIGTLSNVYQPTAS
jgi:2-keto-4-pentenoate hydratase/2-oxohepta-3-ene-1,7-dioic acid hydratase in catechol pathway